MKIRRRQHDSSMTVTIEGEIDSSRCDCLQHFWDQHVPDSLPALHIDMGSVDDIDAIGVATCVDLIRRAVEQGTEVTLDAAPQMLAHTLYKTAVMHRLVLRHPREEEPYAG